MENNVTYFTKEMAKEYTILVPPIFPLHEDLLLSVMSDWGYKLKLMTNSGEDVMRKGLKYCHNDTCYPAQIVIGQMMDVIESGEYDVHKIAFLITQTGGGCRASNYIALMRKALSNAGYSFIPIISMNFNPRLENSGFTMPLPMLYRMVYCALFGDLIMSLRNQSLPYEINKGETQALVEEYKKRIVKRFGKGKIFTYSTVKKYYKNIVKDFSKIKLSGENKVKVGIVGEIFVKFSPYGNNELEKFLIENGAEPVMGGVVDFCMYCISNGIHHAELYDEKKAVGLIMNIGTAVLAHKQKALIKAIKKYSSFQPMSTFKETEKAAKDFICLGVKMGEGWLLTGEMLELCNSGVKNIICTQPFGCLPNHIVGKGMIKGIKELHKDANIVSVDYDFSSTKTNQENRIRLMLANAYKNL